MSNIVIKIRGEQPPVRIRLGATVLVSPTEKEETRRLDFAGQYTFDLEVVPLQILDVWVTNYNEAPTVFRYPVNELTWEPATSVVSLPPDSDLQTGDQMWFRILTKR